MPLTLGDGVMVDLLMLGIIPGTQIQVNFGGWLICSALLVVLLLTYAIHRKRIASYLLIAIVIQRSIRQVKQAAPPA